MMKTPSSLKFFCRIYSLILLLGKTLFVYGCTPFFTCMFG